MKVLFYFPFYNSSTAAIIRREALVKGFRELKVDAKNVYLQSSDLNNDESTIILSKKSNLHNKLLLVKNITRLSKIINKGDVISLYTFSPFEILFFSIICFFTRAKLYNEITEYPDVVGSKGLKNSLLEVLMRMYLDGLFVISKTLQQYYLSKGIKKDKIYILSMLVDNSRFDGLKKQGTNIAEITYCGTASNNKDGVNHLLEAFAIVKKHFPDLKLRIIGLMNDSDKEVNYSIIENNQIKNDVIFMGRIPSCEIPQQLINAKLLVLARPNNKQSEGGFPTKLGEYLATGNPVVATNVGEISHYLTHNKDIIFAEPNNISDIAEKILWVMSHPSESKQIGKAGKLTSIQLFGYKNKAEEMLKQINK